MELEGNGINEELTFTPIIEHQNDNRVQSERPRVNVIEELSRIESKRNLIDSDLPESRHTVLSSERMFNSDTTANFTGTNSFWNKLIEPFDSLVYKFLLKPFNGLDLTNLSPSEMEIYDELINRGQLKTLIKSVRKDVLIGTLGAWTLAYAVIPSLCFLVYRPLLGVDIAFEAMSAGIVGGMAGIVRGLYMTIFRGLPASMNDPKNRKKYITMCLATALELGQIALPAVSAYINANGETGKNILNIKNVRLNQLDIRFAAIKRKLGLGFLRGLFTGKSYSLEMSDDMNALNKALDLTINFEPNSKEDHNQGVLIYRSIRGEKQKELIAGISTNLLNNGEGNINHFYSTENLDPKEICLINETIGYYLKHRLRYLTEGIWNYNTTTKLDANSNLEIVN